VFNIWIESVLVVENLDVYARVGALSPYFVLLRVPVLDRNVTIQFERVVNDPFISAIEVLEINNSTIAPINTPTAVPVPVPSQMIPKVLRVNAGGSPYNDTFGNKWIGDQYFHNNGAISTRDCTRDIVNTTDEELYCTQRYFRSIDTTPFMYEIPVHSTADYQVRLHFSENVSQVIEFFVILFIYFVLTSGFVLAVF
jgi:hypothetical protein